MGQVGRELESTRNTTEHGLEWIPRFGKGLDIAIYGVIRVLRASSRCGLPSRIGLIMPQPSGGEQGASQFGWSLPGTRQSTGSTRFRGSGRVLISRSTALYGY